jgi:MEMO1 family protein
MMMKRPGTKEVRDSMQNTVDMRPSPIAGRWYSADPQQLAKEVDQYIQAAILPVLEGEVVAVVAPHAGHFYSGPVAGYAFAALRGLSPSLVAVVSPMHHPYSESILSSAHQAYTTPLGSITIAEETLAELDQNLQKRLGFGISRIRRDPEHSLEIELPFLQRVLPNPFQLLPVMMRDQNLEVARALGAALAEAVAGQDAVLVASTDLSHFYPQKTAEVFDSVILQRVAAFDPEGVLKAEAEGKGFACGHGALAAVLWASQALGADQVKILNYATSGDIRGDYQQVVGYGAAVVTRKEKGSAAR